MRFPAVLCLLALATPAWAADDESGPANEMRRVANPALLRLLGARRLTPAQLEAKRGDFWMLMKQPGRAEVHYKKALALDPKLVQARYGYAVAAWRLGRAEEAVQELEKLLKDEPKHMSAFQALADLHIEKKSWDAALEVLGRALAAAPNQPAVLLYLGRVSRFKLEGGSDDALRARAREYLEKAAQAAAPGSAVALAAARELTLLQYGPLGEKIANARDLLARGDAAGALAALDEVVKQQADIAEAHFLRGVALSSPKLNKVAEAIAAYKQAATPDALVAIAQLHYEKGEMEDAEDWLKKALQADPKHQNAQYQLGLIFKELGEYDKAIAAWRQTVALGPRTKQGQWAATKLQVLTGQVKGLAEGEVLDPAAERHLGQRFMESIEKKFGFVNDDALTARLETIARKLIAVSDRSGENLRYEIKVVNQKAVNAVTFPGGKILVYKGMIDLIKNDLGDSDDAYAAVLGHEIAHAALRHGVTKAKILSARSAMDSSHFSATLTLHSFLSGFSRHNEFEADQYGALYAYRAGFKPYAGVELHRAMGARREVPPGMSHPPHRERIERLREYLLELRAKTRTFKLGLKALAQHHYARAVQHFEVFLGVFPDSLAGHNNLGLAMYKKALLRIPPGAYKKSTDVDPKAKIPAIALRAGAPVEKAAAPVIDRPLLREAIAELRMALQSDPSYVAAHVNMGAAMLDLGADREGALGHLLTAVRLDPENRHAQNNLAVAYLTGGDKAKGLEILGKLAEGADAHPDAVYNLAVAKEQAGDKAAAAQLYARYAELDKDSGWGKLAAERAAALK